MTHNKSKPTIICIVGPSGSGKTTLARFIEALFDIPALVSYTTRPPRPNEANGVDHHFVSDNDLPPREQMLAYTYFAGNHYWVPKASLIGTQICTYVIDEKGLVTLKEQYQNTYNIVSILIKRDSKKIIQTVGNDRVCRDKERIVIPDSDYDLILCNNQRIEDFLAKSIKVLYPIYQQNYDRH